MSGYGGPYLFEEDGVVFYFDALNKKCYSAGTTVNNLLGNETGTLTNGCSVVDKSFVFDGDNDFIDLGSIDSTHPLSLYNVANFSIEFWVKLVISGDSYQRIIDKSSGAGGVDGWYIFFHDSPITSRRIGFGLEGTNPIDYSGNIYSGDTWYQFIFIKEGNIMSLYKNATKVTQGDMTSIVIPPTTTNARIGSWNHSDSRELNGEISLFRVYHRALSDSEIKNNYDSFHSRFGLPRYFSYKYSPILKLDPVQSTSSVFEDVSGNGNDVILVNSPPYNTTYYSFNGSSQYGYVKNLIYGPTFPISEMSVFAWVRTTYNNGNVGVWSNDIWSILDFDRSEAFTFAINGAGEIQMNGASSNNGGIDPQGTGFYDLLGNTLVNDGNWHFIGWTFSVLNQEIVMYVDGGIDATFIANGGMNALGTGAAVPEDRYGFIGDGSEANVENGTRNNIYYQGDIGLLEFYDNVAVNSEYVNFLYNNSKANYI